MRAASAKQAFVTAAVALFLAAMVAARLTHPAHASQSSTDSSSTASSTDDYSYGNSGDDYQSGWIQPSQSSPQVSTGGS